MDLKDAQNLALATMREHLDDRWTFGWDNAVSRLGACHYREKKITLSRPMTLASTVEQVTDTVRHEVAHALAGAGAGHGRAWKLIAIQLGATPRSTAVNAPNLRAEGAPWVGTCPNGHTSPGRFWRKPRNRRSCGQCSPGRYDERYAITYRRVDTLAGVR